jgi:Zn-dependent oligopeptidase
MSSLSVIILNYKDITSAIIRNIKDDYISNLEKVNDIILKIPFQDLIWDNFIQPFIDFHNTYTNTAILNMKNFHQSEEIRELCSDIDSELEQYNINNNMRKDIYNAYKYYYTNTYPNESSKLTNEQQNYMKVKMVEFNKLGLGLDDEPYNRVKEIKNEISELSSSYELNVDNYSREFFFTPEQLDGLPQSYIDERKTEDGKIKVTLQYPDYIPLMEYCKDRNIRKMMIYEYKRRAYDTNVDIAEKIFKLKQEQAKLFGFENHSDYELDDSMAGSTKEVMKFLDNLYEKIKPLQERDYNLLLEYSLPDYISKLESYDIQYYSNKLIENKTQLKKEDLKKYFPIFSTIQAVFKIYEQILDYKFIEVTHLSNISNTLWHEDVKLYEVHENEIIKGAFYVDLHPRDGKFGHAAVFPLISKSKDTLPIAAIACNFARDYLNFDELETFFHEFGHVMHHISSKSTISETASFSCEADFVETPSQMFEEWCYVNSVLKILNEDKSITDDIIEKIKQQRNILQGWHVARQLSFCYMDMHIHSKQYDGNSYEVTKKFTKQICNIDTLENTNEISSFGHLINGYDAGYYGYMWSLVYAKDLFSIFKNNELDKEIGKKFKNEILSQGSIRPSIESVKIFLNREPNLDAFINSII